MYSAPDTNVPSHHLAAQKRRLVRALMDSRDEEYPDRVYPALEAIGNRDDEGPSRPTTDMVMIGRILDDMLQKLSATTGKPAPAQKRTKPTLRLSTGTQAPQPTSQMSAPPVPTAPLLPLPGSSPTANSRVTTPPIPIRAPLQAPPPSLAALRAGTSQRTPKSRRKLPGLIVAVGLLLTVAFAWLWTNDKRSDAKNATPAVSAETAARTRIAIRTLSTVTHDGGWQVEAPLSGDVNLLRDIEPTPPAAQPQVSPPVSPPASSTFSAPAPSPAAKIPSEPSRDSERLTPAVAPSSSASAPPANLSTSSPRPRASIAFQAYVEALRITGVLQRERVRAVIDGRTVFAGDMVDAVLGVRLVSADLVSRLLWFEDATGAQLSLPY